MFGVRVANVRACVRAFLFCSAVFCFVRRRVLSGRRYDVFCSDALFGDFSPELFVRWERILLRNDDF